MNIINRILVVLESFIILVIALIVLINPFGTLMITEGALVTLDRKLSTLYFASPFYFTLGQILLAILISILLLLLLFLEIRPTKKDSVRVKIEGSSKATVATDTVAQRLIYRLDQLPEVLNVYPRISGHKEAVNVQLVLETTPDINIPVKTQEVTALAKEVVEEQMGLTLGKFSVHIKHVPYPANSSAPKKEEIPGGL